jgi:hypothetical protein
MVTLLLICCLESLNVESHCSRYLLRLQDDCFSLRKGVAEAEFEVHVAQLLRCVIFSCMSYFVTHSVL